MRPRRIHLDDIQALIFLQTLFQLLFRKTLSQYHGFHQLELNPLRSGRYGEVSDNVEHIKGNVFSTPFAFGGASLISCSSLIVVCQT